MFSGGNGAGSDPSNSPRLANVIIPELSLLAQQGEELFNVNCAACHGDNAGGTDNGPALVHDIYNPGHHPDQAFVRAAITGVRAHHWGFGNMPPVDGITQEEVLVIARYIRELQQANGIATLPHDMQ
ncbi:Cytochrome c family protein [hydrothermal vent metagenome]|uniref:Cytochrome c family protein n=1 Tax=hydrothermal vent metagenome TaxID=652676 RepID=A0A3B0TRG9_9ZZZZ